MSPQGGKKKLAKTHIRQGQTDRSYIDSLADQAAGIRQVNPDKESRWKPDDEQVMTKDIREKLDHDFSLPGQKRAQPRQAPRQQRPAQPRQQQRPPQKPKTRPALPRQQQKKPAPPPPSKSQEIVAKAKIISEKYKRGELSTEQYKSMRNKLAGMVTQEIKATKKKISVLENKFLNNQVSMAKYNAAFDALNKELNRLTELRKKVSPK